MDKNELLLEAQMDYNQLIKYLIEKYGSANWDYFKVSETGIKKNEKVTRTSEGLFCHHIDEDKGYDLSSPYSAMEQSIDYQKKERLVYCNYIEHLLLHILISKDRFWKEHEGFNVPKDMLSFLSTGIQFICKDINTLYSQEGSSVKWKNRCYQEISENYGDYIFIINEYIQYIVNNFSGNKSRKLLGIGGKLYHKKLGEGIVVQIDTLSSDLLFDMITVQFSAKKVLVMRGKVEKGGFAEFLECLRAELSKDNTGKCIKCIYDEIDANGNIRSN